MRNDLTPGYCRIHYYRTGSSHTMTLGVKYDGIPASGADPTLVQKGGGTIAGSAGVSALVTVLKQLYNADTTFGSFEFWYKASSSSDPAFLYSNDIVGGTGVHASATVVAGQGVLTFRTVNHGLFRLYLMENVISGNTKLLAPIFSGSTPLQNINTYVIGNTSWLYGRDDSFPTAGVSWVPKINDVLRKKLLI